MISTAAALALLATEVPIMTPSPIPVGLRIVSPFLAIHRARETIEFLKAAFAAIELETHAMPDGRILNAIVKIGDSTILIGERSGAVEDPSGNQWWIATHTEDLSREELVARALKRGR